jgi:hypothetical protein
MSCDTTTEPFPGHAQNRGDVGDSHAYDAFLGASELGLARRPTRDQDVPPPATAAPHGSTCHVMTRVFGPIILALETARAAGRTSARATLRAATPCVSSSRRSVHRCPPDLAESAPLWIRVLG